MPLTAAKQSTDAIAVQKLYFCCSCRRRRVCYCSWSNCVSEEQQMREKKGESQRLTG